MRSVFLALLALAGLAFASSLTGMAVPLSNAASTAQPADPAWSAPRLREGSSASTNWAGYAVTGPRGSVSDVKGSWVVPAVSCAAGETSYSSFWVGIDGFNSGSVEQTGTDSDCRSGTPTYYAWSEFYPKPMSVARGIAVHPGDVVRAEAVYTGGRFTVSLNVAGQAASVSAKANSAARSSAEWIAEAPSSSGGVLPLANFGNASFGQDSTAVASTSYATVSGVTGPLGSFGANVQSIAMVTPGGALKAQPSALSSDGTSFGVQWVSRGP